MLIKVNLVKKSVSHLILKGLHTTPHKSQSHHHMCLREHCMSHVQGWWGFDWVCAIPQGRQTNRNDHQQKMANISKCDASRFLQNICQRNNSSNNHSYIFKWLCKSLIEMLFYMKWMEKRQIVFTNQFWHDVFCCLQRSNPNIVYDFWPQTEVTSTTCIWIKHLLIFVICR